MRRDSSVTRGTYDPRALLAFVVLLEFAASCGKSPAPTASRQLPTTLPSAAPFTTATALVIERPYVLVFPPSREGYPFAYEPRFLLKDTTGIGATIENIAVIGPGGGSDNTGPGCWRDTLRVPGNGTLDTFYTDEGKSWLGYCAPASGGRSGAPTLELVVTFVDDDGRPGTVRALATVAR